MFVYDTENCDAKGRPSERRFAKLLFNAPHPAIMVAIKSIKREIISDFNCRERINFKQKIKRSERSKSAHHNEKNKSVGRGTIALR